MQYGALRLRVSLSLVVASTYLPEECVKKPLGLPVLQTETGKESDYFCKEAVRFI